MSGLLSMCVCGSVHSHASLCMRVAIAFVLVRNMSRSEYYGSAHAHHIRVYTIAQIRITIIVYNKGPEGVQSRAGAAQLARWCLSALHTEEGNMRVCTTISFSAGMCCMVGVRVAP